MFKHVTTADRGELVTERAHPDTRTSVSTAAARAVSLRPIPMEAIQVGGSVVASLALDRDIKAAEAGGQTSRRRKAA